MNILYNKNSFDNAVEVDNYPWGFRLKTKRRYWVETTKHGDRDVVCTLNPKTNQWCKPKKSTYDAVSLLYVADNGHVKSTGIGKHMNDEQLQKALQKIDYNKLSKMQKAKICEIKSINHVMKNVTWTVEKTSEYNLSDPADLARMKADANSPETKAREAEQAKQNQLINRSIDLVYKTCLLKNNLV
jgi:hypothetical protein